MHEIEWIFSGIGTSILVILFSLLLGCGIGYMIGIKNSNKQSQRTGNNSNATQIGNINNVK